MKRIPQYGEMVPGRLKSKIDGLNVTLLDCSPLLRDSLRYGFMYNRKKGLTRRYDWIDWWRRFQFPFMREYNGTES